VYKDDCENMADWGSVLVRCCCEKLVTEARGQFGNLEEEERLSLEAAAEQRLEKTATHREDLVCSTMIL
jgi:hypothetical protein